MLKYNTAFFQPITQVEERHPRNSKTTSGKDRMRKRTEQLPFFSTRVTSSLHVVVNTSCGNTEEMIGFKRGLPPLSPHSLCNLLAQ